MFFSPSLLLCFAGSCLGSDSVSVLKASIVYTRAGWLSWGGGGGRGFQVSWFIVVVAEEVFPLQSQSVVFISSLFHPYMCTNTHSVTLPLPFSPRCSLSLLSSLLLYYALAHVLVRQAAMSAQSARRRRAEIQLPTPRSCANTLCLLLIYAGSSKAARGMSRENHFPWHEESVLCGF